MTTHQNTRAISTRRGRAAPPSAPTSGAGFGWPRPLGGVV